MKADLVEPVRKGDSQKLLGRCVVGFTGEEDGLQLSLWRGPLKETKLYKFIHFHMPGWTARSGHVYSILEVWERSLWTAASLSSTLLTHRSHLNSSLQKVSWLSSQGISGFVRWETGKGEQGSPLAFAPRRQNGCSWPKPHGCANMTLNFGTTVKTARLP